MKIYKTPNKHRDNYTLSYCIDGKRKRQVFAELSAARTEASQVASRLSKGIASVIDVAPNVQCEITGGIGIRYWF